MLTTQYAPLKQAGNGVITVFDGAWKILVETDLVVYKIDASGVQTGPLILNTDYTVEFDSIAEIFSVTYTVAPVAGGYSLIQRESDDTQQTLFPREGPAPAKMTEASLDKLQAQLQEHEYAIDIITVLAMPFQIGTFSALSSIAQTGTPFIGICIDIKMIQIWTGNVLYGQNGWVSLNGW